MYKRGMISETLRALWTLGVGEKGLAEVGPPVEGAKVLVTVMRGHVFWCCGVRV